MFERNSFELHPEKARPYDVLLGRLGDVRLQQDGRHWANLPKGQQAGGCTLVCRNQVNSVRASRFKSYWEGHGLQDRWSIRSLYAVRLALFGFHCRTGDGNQRHGRELS